MRSRHLFTLLVTVFGCLCGLSVTLQAQLYSKRGTTCGDYSPAFVARPIASPGTGEAGPFPVKDLLPVAQEDTVRGMWRTRTSTSTWNSPAGRGYIWSYHTAFTYCYYIIRSDGTVGGLVSDATDGTGYAECIGGCVDENCEPIYTERKGSTWSPVATGPKANSDETVCDPEDDGSGGGGGGDGSYGLYCDVYYQYNPTTQQFSFYVDWGSCVLVAE